MAFLTITCMEAMEDMEKKLGPVSCWVEGWLQYLGRGSISEPRPRPSLGGSRQGSSPSQAPSPGRDFPHVVSIQENL